MLLVFVILLLASILLLLILWYLRKWNTDRALCYFKGPELLPILGNALAFGDSARIPMISNPLPFQLERLQLLIKICFTMTINETQGQSLTFWLLTCALTYYFAHVVLTKMLEYYNKYGSYRVMVGFRAAIVVGDYNLVEFFMNSNTHLVKNLPYKMLHNWLGTGLLTGAGDKWRKHRKILTPAFHFKILETFLPLFDKASNILVDKLRESVDAKSVNIYPYITKLTLDLICESAMGISVNAQINPNTKYIAAVKEMCQIIVYRTFSAFKGINNLYLLTPTYQNERRCVKYLQEATTTVIKQRRKVLEEEHNNGKEATDNEDQFLSVGAKKKFLFLDVLLKARVDGEPLNDVDIRDEVNTFLFAGHDTTASGISFTLYALANHPEVQSRVVDELHQIFADEKDRTATYQDLQDMKYLDMVIKESLRLYPPVPVIGREQPYDMEYDGHIIPAYTGCILFLYGVHRNPKYFPDPEKFDPERFSHDSNFGKAPFSYIPFSAGPRNCIGQKFAVLEMKATIAKILRNYKLVPCEDHQLKLVLELTLKSSTGIKIKLENRIW